MSEKYGLTMPGMNRKTTQNWKIVPDLGHLFIHSQKGGFHNGFSTGKDLYDR